MKIFLNVSRRTCDFKSYRDETRDINFWIALESQAEERERQRERERERDAESFWTDAKGDRLHIRQRCWKFAIGVLINSIAHLYLNGDLARGTTATF